MISLLLAAVGIGLLDRASRRKRANDAEDCRIHAGTAPAGTPQRSH